MEDTNNELAKTRIESIIVQSNTRGTRSLAVSTQHPLDYREENVFFNPYL